MNLQKLRDKIVEGFNLAELRNLCFDLDIEYENLDGSTLNDKTRELVEFCKRHNRLPELVTRCKELRSRISWQDVTETIDQRPPQIREDKLLFLCWVYIKSNGNILQPANSEDIANMIRLTQLETIRVAQYLTENSLVQFARWVMGIKITHQGIVKAEYDILQGYLRNDFPTDIVTKIRGRQQIRSEFLDSLYAKSKPTSFQSISVAEIADDIGSNHHQLISEGVIHYLKDEGWLRIRTAQNVQITEAGIEKFEAENE